MTTLNQRARRAEVAVNQYCRHFDASMPMATVITDLLADIMHLCDREQLDIDDIADRAVDHYEAEKAGEL